MSSQDVEMQLTLSVYNVSNVAADIQYFICMFMVGFACPFFIETKMLSMSKLLPFLRFVKP